MAETQRPPVHTSLLGQFNKPSPLERQEDASDFIPWVIEFRVVGTPDIIQAPMGERLIIGRTDPEQRNFPDIDLTPYEGRSLGVSRQHVCIEARDNRITLTDLGSANGTCVNGHLIPAQQATRIHDGDRIRLGKLEMQLRFVVKPTEDERTMIGTGNPLNVPSIGAGETILIAHENREVCRLLTYVIRKANFTPITVSSVDEALSYIDQNLPSGMIVELTLSQNRGLDVLRYYTHRAGTEMPSMVVVASTGGYLAEQAIEAGGDMVLWEPVVLEQLLIGLRTMGRLMHER